MTTDMDPPSPQNPSTTAIEEFPSTEPETKTLDDELPSTSAPPENPMAPPPPKNSEPSESGGSHEHPPQEEVLKEGSIIDQSHVDEKEASMCGRVDLCDFVLEHATISRFHADNSCSIRMNVDAVHEAPASSEDMNTVEPEAELTNIDSLEVISSHGDMVQEVGTAFEFLTRIELDLACSWEKLMNLNILIMHVATRESDFEVFVSDNEHTLVDCIVKAMEFDILSGILDSEMREVHDFLSSVQIDIVSAGEIVSSCKHLGQPLKEMEDKLHDSEQSLQQALDQVSEIRVQSAKFQKILSTYGEGNNGIDLSGNNELLDQNANIRMQTAEQQRHILRMLEKSLARELDLEKKIGESRQTEEELKLKMHASEQEFLFMEEEEGVIWERLYEAENTAEVLMGISKETLGRLLIAQLNLNGSIKHAENLRFELQESVIKLEAKDSALKNIRDKLTTADSEAVQLREKVTSLEKKLKESDTELLNAKASADVSHAVHSKMHEMEKEIEDLKEKISRAENTAESAEAKCKLLTETNLKLNAELDIFRGSGSASEKVDSLEKQLGESNFQLQHALAAAEASKEKQSMLYSTVHDMENVIEGLKLRVSKAENRADSAEEKCIILSESNSYLNEERNFLMSRLKCLEAALHKAEETKLETANDIGIRTKLITNLVMQLALERERLHKQILSLTKENNILLQQADKNPSRTSYDDGKGNYKDLFPKVGSGAPTSAGEIKETINFSATSTKGGMTSNIASVGEAESEPADPTSTLESARNIDARQLNLKYSFMAAVTLVISTLAAIWFQNRQGQF